MFRANDKQIAPFIVFTPKLCNHHGLHKTAFNFEILASSDFTTVYCFALITKELAPIAYFTSNCSEFCANEKRNCTFSDYAPKLFVH